MSFPVCIAAKILKIKIILFEPNTVIGKANRTMINISYKIICYHNNLKLFPTKHNNKIYLVDRILRKEIYSCKKIIKKILEK